MQKLTPNIHRMTFSQLITRDWRLYLMLVLLSHTISYFATSR